MGSSSYHPQMLLKVLVYGYVTNIYSSRKLAAACKESIYFMWLSSMSSVLERLQKNLPQMLDMALRKTRPCLKKKRLFLL